MDRRERGEGRLALLLMVIIVAAIIFVLVKAVPPRVNAYQFKDFMTQYSREDCWNRSHDQMVKDLLDKAKELNLPITSKDIKVSRQGAYINMEAHFDVPVDLKVYRWVMHYDFKQTAEHY
jgi:hypothetical protein